MTNDELQVLGTSGRQKKSPRLIASVGFAILAAVVLLGMWLYSINHSKDKKAFGDSTIKPALQHAADSLLNAQLERLDGLQGQVIVMDVKTGEVLAMVGRERTFDGNFQLCNNFAYQQEPGSTMMIPAVMAMLETGNTKLTDEFDTQEGIWNIEGGIIIKDHNWHRGGYGNITLEKALEVSSNIAISKAIQKTFKGNEQRYFELLDKMSLGKPDSIDGIDNLRPMFFTSPKDSVWARDQFLYSSIGYERRLAPIQTLTFYNAIANDGKMVKPMVFKGDTKVINEQIASKKTIKEIQHSLYNIVYQGLGKKAGSELTSVAGKTGTASVGTLLSGNNEITEFHVSFCGYFPADKPKYSIIVSMNKYGLPASGGLMAGEVFHNIVEWMVKHKMLQ